MGAKIDVIDGTNMAVCHICKKIIKRGEKAIRFMSYNGSGQVHCHDKDCER